MYHVLVRLKKAPAIGQNGSVHNRRPDELIVGYETLHQFYGRSGQAVRVPKLGIWAEARPIVPVQMMHRV